MAQPVQPHPGALAHHRFPEPPPRIEPHADLPPTHIRPLSGPSLTLSDPFPTPFRPPSGHSRLELLPPRHAQGRHTHRPAHPRRAPAPRPHPAAQGAFGPPGRPQPPHFQPCQPPPRNTPQQGAARGWCLLVLAVSCEPVFSFVTPFPPATYAPHSKPPYTSTSTPTSTFPMRSFPFSFLSPF